MNRRSFLQTTAALAVASLVPTWLKVGPAPINLQAFCGEDTVRSGDMRAPFVQGQRDMHKFATDGRICVRVPAHENYPLLEAVKRPPAERLAWEHDDLRGWKSWPRQDWLTATESDCLTCSGYGNINRHECVVCDGWGQYMSGSNASGHFSPVRCKACNGIGNIGDLCQTCKGEKPHWGVRPGIQRVGDQYINVHFDQLVRRELGECEYVVKETMTGGPTKQPWPLIFFRFNGGVGLLCSLDRDAAEKRLREAVQR